MATEARSDVEVAEWPDFVDEFTGAHEPGEHVAIVGPTGQGKTTLALALLDESFDRQPHRVILATKPRDDALKQLRWPIIRRWPPDYGKDRVILWPEYTPEKGIANQRKTFGPALTQIFRDGARVVYFDEAWWFAEKLRMGDRLDEFLVQGRSMNLSVVCGTQRPVNVPRTVFSEPSWVFFFRSRDVDELRRVGEIGGSVDTATIREEIQRLDRYEFLCVRKTTGEMVKSKVEI